MGKGKGTSPARKQKRESESRYERLRKKRKLVRVALDPYIMAGILKHGTDEKIIAEGLPKDATYHGWADEPLSRTIQFYFGHESFKSIKEGVELPAVMVTFTKETDGKDNSNSTDKSK